MVPAMPRLTVIGSSDAFNSAGRFHSCYWLDGAGDAPVMIDFGSTALAAVRRVGRSPLELGAVLVTHLHGDHIGGFPHLLINSLYNDVREDALDVVGPVHTEERVERLFQTVYPKLGRAPAPYALRYQELAPGDDAHVLGLRVEAFPAAHMDPPDVPLCLRVTTASGHVVAFSGDTEPCEGLLAAAADADLLVAECTALEPPAGRHLTWRDWQALWPRIGAKKVLLTHFNRDVRAAIPRLRGEVPASVVVDFAEDGQVLDI